MTLFLETYVDNLENEINFRTHQSHLKGKK